MRVASAQHHVDPVPAQDAIHSFRYWSQSSRASRPLFLARGRPVDGLTGWRAATEDFWLLFRHLDT